MANKQIAVKVRIYPDILRKLIEQKSSIRRMDREGVCSTHTIRQGLKTGLLTVDIVTNLACHLKEDPRSFADIDGYFYKLRRYIYHEED